MKLAGPQKPNVQESQEGTKHKQSKKFRRVRRDDKGMGSVGVGETILGEKRGRVDDMDRKDSKKGKLAEGKG